MKNISFLLTAAILSCGNTQTANIPQHTVSVADSVAADVINLKSYGAKGLGVSSIKEDTTALRNAIAYLNKHGGGKLYVPDPPKFYAFAGEGIFVGDNIEIYGDGKGKSEIRNVSPTGAKFLNGTIFLFSTYEAPDNLSIFQPGIDQYPFGDVRKNDSVINLKNKADASNLKIGEVVALGANKFVRGTVKEKQRFHSMELNEIKSIQDGSVYFKYPFSIAFNTDQQGNAPVVVNINNTNSKNFLLGIRNGSSKNIYLHDLTLSQAQTDELNNVPISKYLRVGLSGVWQPGGAFNSRFQNLRINAYSALGGNMFTRCSFSNIDLFSKKKLIDFGYGGSNDTVHDIKWTYMESAASDFASSFIICNDGTHNILMYNIEADGDWNGESIMLLTQVKNITMQHMTFNFPNYNKENSLIQISDKLQSASRDIKLDDIKITVGAAGCFMSVIGEDDIVDENRNINISNIYLKGNISQNTDALSDNSLQAGKRKGFTARSSGKSRSPENEALVLKNINGLTLNNINVPSGELYFENCNNSTIDKLIAPSSQLTMKQMKNNTKFNQLTVKSKVED